MKDNRPQMYVSLTGIALTAWYKGRGGLRGLGQRLIPWRSAAHWYLIVVMGYAAIAGIALWTAVFFGSTSSAVSYWPLFFHGLLPAIARDPGPAGEEFGWRDSRCHYYWSATRPSNRA